jgi:hypothetical protein
MKLTAIALLGLCLLAAPAQAYLDTVDLPPGADTGQTVTIAVLGGLTSSCWEFQDFETSLTGQLALVEITLINDTPPEISCLPVITPYDVYPEFVFNEAGTYTVRVVEHRFYLGSPLEDQIWEGTIEVTGETADQPVSWSAVKALYR